MKVRRLLLILGTLLLLSTLVVPAFAQGGEREGKVVYGKDFTLEEGEIIEGDLAVLGGDLELKEGSEVNGDLVVLGGDAKIKGYVWGNVAVTGGHIEVKDSAVIEGDLVIVGGKLDIDENATVEGEITYPDWGDWGKDWQEWSREWESEWEEGFPEPPPVPDKPLKSTMMHNPLVQLIINMMQAVIWTLIMIVLAVIAVLFLPKQTRLIRDTLVQQPILAIGVGLITLFAFPIAMVVLAITICLPPIVAIALLLASAWGWVAMGWLIGERVLQERYDTSNPLAPAVLGTAIPTFAVAVIWGLKAIPILGFLFGLLGFITWVLGIGAGVGAVLLTKFGTTSYPWASKAASAKSSPKQLPASPETKKLVPEDEADTDLDKADPHGTD